MKRVYLLQHERSDDGDVKTLGIYSSEQEAASALDRLRGQPGFRDYPDGFTIGPYLLDEVYWAEGFMDL
jgi:homoserine kinase type II